MAELPKVKLTQKQENFCKKYIELGNASEAYRQSYDADSMNSNTVNRKAKELMDNDKIKVRVEQLQAEHKKRHNLTVDDLLLELENARKTALACETPQTSAAISATMGKAKLLGLDKQVVQHIGDTDNPISHNINLTLEEVLKAREAILDEY